METVQFAEVPFERVAALQRSFDIIKSGKDAGQIDEAAVAQALGPVAAEAFVSDQAEIEAQLSAWQQDRSIEVPWEFGSWIDALSRAELALMQIHIGHDGSGALSFEQLAWPSSGLDALEHLVKAFGGRVVANSAI